MLKKLYLGPLGVVVSIMARVLRSVTRPRMLYGHFDWSKRRYLKHVRISSTASLSGNGIDLEDHVWVWHHSVVDGSHCVRIGEGVQIGAFCGIFTHGSHIAIRLLGKSFISLPMDQRVGYVRGPVEIGAYSFIGTGALILPNTKLGRGTIVTPNAVVAGQFPDFAVIKGDPGKVVGDARDLDRRYLRDLAVRQSYFDPIVAEAIAEQIAAKRTSGRGGGGSFDPTYRDKQQEAESE